MTPARFQTEYLSQAATFYRVAFYILEDATEAEDAVQELFLRLWNGRDALDGIRNPAGYGIRVLRNLCLDRIRRSRSRNCPPARMRRWTKRNGSPRSWTPSNPCPNGSGKS